MNIKTDTKTTIEATGQFKDGCFNIPRKIDYDGQEERFDILNLSSAIKQLDIPKGEYKITIILEKI